MMYVDPSGMVIKISGSPAQVQEYFNATQALTNNKLKLSSPILDENGNAYYIVEEVSVGESDNKSVGTELIYELIHSEFHIDVSPYEKTGDAIADENNANNGVTRPNIRENAFNGKGTGSTINIGDKIGKGGGNINLIGKNGEILKDQQPSLVRTLAHEYIHALHNIDGRRNENLEIEESLTVGEVSYSEKNIDYKHSHITENAIAVELNEAKRAKY